MNNVSNNNSTLNWFIWLTLVVEGGALMATELIGAKLIAPFYGTSVYVWAAVLATTLGGLTIGYYSGGIISYRHPKIKVLAGIVSLSALLLLSMPAFSGWILETTLSLELRTGILLSCVLFLTPPMVTFGMVGPMAVRLLTKDAKEAGNIAGRVYFTSTAGGIATTFLFGFYLIPYMGLRSSAWITGIALACIPVTYLIFARNQSQLADA